MELMDFFSFFSGKSQAIDPSMNQGINLTWRVVHTRLPVPEKESNGMEGLRACSMPLQGHKVLTTLQHRGQVFETSSKLHRYPQGLSRFLCSISSDFVPKT
jgi:hypothetical protein